MSGRMLENLPIVTEF